MARVTEAPRLVLGPTLQTARLVLRPPSLEDAEPLAAMYADPDVARFIGGLQPPEMVWRMLRAIAGAWALDGFGMFSVIERESGRWIGRVGPWQPLGWPGPEVGWALVRSAWGRGYALEAGTTAIEWAFETLDWSEVVHAVDPANERSKAVMHRLGSRYLRTATMPEPIGGEVEVWGQSRDEWRERSRASR